MPRHTPGNYVPLDVNYPRDAAIRAAGDASELLFVRGLAYCKSTKSDGFIPDYDLEVVAVGLRGVPKRVAGLVTHNLWVREGNGHRVRSWDKWNQPVSSENAFLEGQSKAGTKGNHERWHSARGITDPACDWCNPNRTPDRVPDPEPDRAPESPLREGKGREGDTDADAPARPDIEALCEHLHRRITGNGSKATITNAWRESARLLLDRDNRPEAEAHALIDWCQDSDFWRPNIGGMPKFRAKYDTLRLQAQSRGGLRIVRPGGDGWTTERLESVLGPDRWRCPQPPPGMTSDEQWEWRNQQAASRRQQRVREAETKQRGGVA